MTKKMYNVRNMTEMVAMSIEERNAYFDSQIVNCDVYDTGEWGDDKVTFLHPDGTEAWFGPDDTTALVLLDKDGKMIGLAPYSYRGWLGGNHSRSYLGVFTTFSPLAEDPNRNDSGYDIFLDRLYIPIRGQEPRKAGLYGCNHIEYRD